MPIHVTKRNGDKALFDPQKLKKALEASGADRSEQDIITQQVEENLYEGIRTDKIYKLAHQLLKKQSHKQAGRYSLKRAIMELGPTGFPFEKFVGRVFETMGYEAQTGIIVQGKCVTHEVDVIARKGNEMIMIECKFHSDNTTKSSVQVPLYIHSRFIDVKAAWEKQYGTKLNYKGGVFTNTRFSEDAMSYGTCAGLMMVSWDAPEGNSLKKMVDNSGLHPITSLISLTKAQKQTLLDNGIVLCRELKYNIKELEHLHIKTSKINRILREADNLIAK